MKNSTKIFITSLAVCTSLGALIVTAKMSRTMLRALYSKPDTLNCSYYFDSANGFTPITSINYDLFNNVKESSYKSWGTVTEQWENSGKTNTYVQSTDKYGNAAAICLYGCNTPASLYPIGSVVEFEFSGSNLSSYNNLPEITSLTSITKAYDRNPSFVQSFEAEDVWEYGYTDSSDHFENAKQYGPIRIRLADVRIDNYSGDNKNATVTTPAGYTVPLYFANVGPSSSISSYIDTALYNMGQAGAFTIYGYLNPFKSSNKSSLQFLLRSTYDIVPSSFTRDRDVVESVSAPSDMKIDYQVGDSFTENRLILNMRDGSQRQADNVEYSGYSMDDAGVYNLSANYYYNAGTLNQIAGNTVREFVTINVNGSIDPGVVPELLEVWGDKKTEYTVGDTFEVPTYVFVDYSDGSWSNVPYECTYTGYDLNTPGTYTVLVSYTYNGVTVTDSYTITVTASGQEKEPSYIQVLYATTEYNVGDSFDTPSVALYYTDGSSKNISYDCLYDGYDMNTPGTYTVEVTYFEGDFVDYTTYTITVSGTVPQNDTITFDSSITSGSYSTGNYGSKYSNGYNFVYYRTTNYSGYVANLLPAVCDLGDPMGGSIANTDPIYGIDSVTIKYSNTSKSDATAGKLSYGATNTLDGSVAIPYSTSEITVTLNLSGTVNFIKIECGNTKLALKEFTVHYTNSGSGYYTPVDAYTNNYRVNPNKYTGTLVAGSTSVTVPVSVSYSGNKYTVLQSKTYTYYTLDYVESHSSVINDAAMTDPVDVANYYSIFGEIPANYGGSGSGMNSVSDVQSVFGSDARQVSYYSRTDGYATAVPNINASQGYYEFDIDIDGSYYPGSGGRGVGRVVAWRYGINNSAYGNGSYRVCHFTDDHYATFQEFNNLGEFLPKFDAERKITGKKWSAANTASAA